MTTTYSVEIRSAGPLRGDIRVPGDKAISHRLAMLGAIAQGSTAIGNFAESADCGSTLQCLRQLGVTIETKGSYVTIEGRGLDGLRRPLADLDAQNSGTTVRLMSGILAAQNFDTTFVGDASLSSRPMNRIIRPLRLFGARIEAREDNYLPMRIQGGPLRAIEYETPIASAQVKSAVLLAGLFAEGVTRVRESLPTRNHTEIALRQFGAGIESSGGFITIRGGVPLHGAAFSVPGDISSAAFLIAAALGLPGSRVRLQGVGVNPTRSGLLTLLQKMGGQIALTSAAESGGEPVADIVVESSQLRGMEIGGSWIPNVIDEIPVLAVLATRTADGIRIRDAGDLRNKESDRIRTVVTNLRRLGAEVEEFPDGLYVPGKQNLHSGHIDSFGDHRIAMAFAVAGLFAQGPVTIEDASCVGISFPGFFDLLSKVQS
jgi:3-phosphoshikimate 1-carboxyvinyltransferase